MKQRLGARADWLDPRRRPLELCRRVVPAIASIEYNSGKIRAARAAVAAEIVALEQGPFLVVQTEPAEGSALIEGPINVEVYGITEPGATVKLNGRNVPVQPDGIFATVTRPVGDECAIRIEAEHSGQRKQTVRYFSIKTE